MVTDVLIYFSENLENLQATCLRPMFYVAFSLYGYGWLERVSVRHCMTFFGYEYLVDHVLKVR